jgi:hypothetical protein
VVIDQEPPAYALCGCLAELLRRPGVGRRARGTHVAHSTRSQLDDEEREHGPEDQIGELEEVARPDLVPLLA